MTTRVRNLSATDMWCNPGADWNAMIEVLSSDPHEEFSPAQREAFAVFIYDGEVQNGGHLQYLHNKGTELVQETLNALNKYNGHAFIAIFTEAIERWSSRARKRASSVGEFVDQALDGEFDDLDQAFSNLELSEDLKLNQWLERHMTDHRDLYFTIHPPATANEHYLASLGRPWEQSDGGRELWTTLLGNEDPRVRISAAAGLIHCKGEARDVGIAALRHLSETVEGAANQESIRQLLWLTDNKML